MERRTADCAAEMILGNKQYPFFNDDLQGAAMKWLRDLANNYYKDDFND